MGKGCGATKQNELEVSPDFSSIGILLSSAEKHPARDLIVKEMEITSLQNYFIPHKTKLSSSWYIV